MTKNEIRRQIKNRRAEMTEEQVSDYSASIHEGLYGLSEFVDCNIIFTYISFANEVDTRQIIKEALRLNKRVFIPRVEDSELNFYEIISYSLDELVRSDFGIMEPNPTIHYRYESSSSNNDIRLMLLPGLAFDKSGNRVGYGAGFYDRYLISYPYDEWIKVALAYDYQIVDNITVDINDIPVDYIITNERIIKASRL